MKIGSLVKFIEWDDPYAGKFGIVTLIGLWDVQVRVPETNEKIWRLARHLELVE